MYAAILSRPAPISVVGVPDSTIPIATIPTTIRASSNQLSACCCIERPLCLATYTHQVTMGSRPRESKFCARLKASSPQRVGA
jgi:hypothetical protein